MRRAEKADVAAPADGDSSWLTLRHFITGVQGARGGDIVRLAALSFSFEELYGVRTALTPTTSTPPYGRAWLQPSDVTHSAADCDGRVPPETRR